MMLKPILASALIAISGLSWATTAIADEQPNILIMGEDADLDTVPRGSRIFNRVLRALETEIQALGFRVYDETAVTMDITNVNRVRRSDAELIVIAQRVPNVPIDVVAVFEIYASVEDNAYADIQDLRVRIPGRLLNVATGQALANYEVSYEPGELPPLPPNCDRDCVLEHVGDQAQRVAADLGAVLATYLDYLSPAPEDANVITQSDPDKEEDASNCEAMMTAYTITFRNFEPEQIDLIEEYLASFSGYDHHRPTQSSASETTYWYETCSATARLQRNLRMMIENMGIEARMDLVNNRIEIDRLRMPVSR
jgi:hypothetical protein